MQNVVAGQDTEFMVVVPSIVDAVPHPLLVYVTSVPEFPAATQKVLLAQDTPRSVAVVICAGVPQPVLV